jgi:hypothetical protein
VLDDITLYWLTNTGVSSGRLYWETHFSLYNVANVSIPAAVTVFPGENYQAPRSWTERAYHKLIYYNFVVAIAVASAAPITAAATPAGATSTAQSLGFADHFVVANGVRLHYVTAGKGDPVLLIPVWPESWYTWRFVMKQMAAAGREAYALDPRGFGDSDARAAATF